MIQNFDDILLELSYRVGIVDLTKEHQVTELINILKENGYDNAFELGQKARVYFSYLNEAKQDIKQVLAKTFTNPDTGNDVMVGTALGYDKTSRAYGIAKGMFNTAGYSEKDIDMVDVGPGDEEKPKKNKSTKTGTKQTSAPKSDIDVTGAEKKKDKKEKSVSISDRINLSGMKDTQIKKYVEQRIVQSREEFYNSKNPDKYATDFLKMRSDEINDNYLRPQGTEGSSLAENNGGKYINVVFNKGGKLSPAEEQTVLKEIMNTKLAKTMSTNQRMEWAKVALETAKTEARVLLTEPKYRAAKKQKQPYPQGVIVDKQSRSMLKNFFDKKIKDDPKNKKHYERQLNFINKLEESDTGVLYELEDGTVGFKHTSNKKTYADPHNNTSVDEKIKAMDNIMGNKMSSKLKKEFEDVSDMVKRASDGLKASCKDFDKERKKLDTKTENAQIKILTKVLTNYPLKLGKRKNYLNDFMGGTPPRKWVQETANELGIKLPTSDENIVRIALKAASKDEPPNDAVICVKKISEMVENVDEKNKSKIAEKFEIDDKELSLVLKTTTSIKDAASGRREVMAEAHTRMVNAIQKADKETKPPSYPYNKNADNGPHQQAYITDYLHRMHFDAYISGERDGVSSQNIGGDNVEPSYYRECLAELSGFKGETETPQSRQRLIQHLSKRLRVYPDSDSVAFGDETTQKQIGKETYRTKGEAKSILGGLGTDMQKCLKGKAKK